MKTLKAVATGLILLGYAIGYSIFIPIVLGKNTRANLNGGEAELANSQMWALLAAWSWLPLLIILIALWWEEIKSFLGWMKTDTEIKIGK